MDLLEQENVTPSDIVAAQNLMKIATSTEGCTYRENAFKSELLKQNHGSESDYQIDGFNIREIREYYSLSAIAKPLKNLNRKEICLPM